MFVHHVAELELVERRSDRDTAKQPLPAMKQLAHLDTVHDSFALRIASSSLSLSKPSATFRHSRTCFRSAYRSRYSSRDMVAAHTIGQPKMACRFKDSKIAVQEW
jgi:hypothetical protein